ncbi:MAG: hypothetical protein JSS28_09090 [Proteobacteria bacterium]|nr:hypothetical protein [Pseudomonadota bacterium]
MKILISCVASALALSAFSGAFAAEAGKANVYRVFTDTVAPAEQDAYEAGVKAYNQCLHDHGVKYSWVAWNHETGNVYSYSYVAGPYTWADFDTMRTQGKACDATWRKQANPHLKGEVSAFMEGQADMTYMPKDADKGPSPEFIGVVLFHVKNGHESHEAFGNAVKKIAAGAEKSKWSGHFATNQINYGDEGAPDYLVVLPNKDWADVGMQANPTLWKMMENVYGKSEAAAIRKSLNDSIEKSSSHIDSYNADLTYTAPK